MKMKVNLNAVKPAGAILILILGALVIAVCFTADLNVPAPYTSLHDADYYTRGPGALGELLTELRENVFPNLSGIERSGVDEEHMKIVITVDKDNYDKAVAVITRDFDKSLFEFVRT